MKNFNYQLHGDFNTNRDAITTDSDNISQTAECAENPDFTNGENRRTICGTTTIYGNRSRYTSGIFLPKIHQNHGLTTPVIHSEFAVRATPRNKAETIRTNKGGCYMAVVEPLLHPFSDKPLSLTKTIYTMLFKFLTGSRLKITIRANSEQEARQRLQLSESAICIARYSNAFLAQKQAKLTACKGVRYA